MSDPDMGAWDYAYDATGNLTKQRDARNQAICFYYDGLNRLVGKTYHSGISDLNALICPGAPYAVSYTYDSTADGNYGRGWRTGMTTTGEGVNSAAWVYDMRGRVTKETRHIAGNSYTTEYSYRADDQVKAITYPSGEVVTFDYNDRGLPVRLVGYETYVCCGR